MKGWREKLCRRTCRKIVAKKEVKDCDQVGVELLEFTKNYN